VSVEARAFIAESRVLSDIRRFVATEADRLTFSRFVNDLQLAVTEACANAILHSGTEEIRVTIKPTGSCLEITVEDDLHLMAAMVDDFSLRRGKCKR
jgi:anti-sigma regulatory factor (Ser/Thr protein kinase)